jgi:hypothetical protein
VTRLPIHGASDGVGWAMMICQSGVRTHYLQSRRENRLETSASIEMAKHTRLSAESITASLYKKSGRPFDQPVGRNDPYAVGDGYIEPVKCSLHEGRLKELRRGVA